MARSLGAGEEDAELLRQVWGQGSFQDSALRHHPSSSLGYRPHTFRCAHQSPVQRPSVFPDLENEHSAFY